MKEAAIAASFMLLRLGEQQSWQWLRGLRRSRKTAQHRAVASGNQRLGCSIVPVHFGEPQRHSQIFFRRAVWRSARVMP